MCIYTAFHFRVQRRQQRFHEKWRLPTFEDASSTRSGELDRQCKDEVKSGEQRRSSYTCQVRMAIFFDECS